MDLSGFSESELVDLMRACLDTTEDDKDFIRQCRDEIARRKLPPMEELIGGAVDPAIVAAGFPTNKPRKTKTGWPEPSAFIQWKGTEVCMDFHCECGAHMHFDGGFAYAVECPHCHAKWEMPSVVYPRKLAADCTYTPLMLEMDADD